MRPIKTPQIICCINLSIQKDFKIEDTQDNTPLPVLTKEFIEALKVPPSNKPTTDTQISPLVSINTYPLMLERIPGKKLHQTTPLFTEKPDTSPSSDTIACNIVTEICNINWLYIT